MSATATEKPVQKFLLLHGSHEQNHPTETWKTPQNVTRPKTVRYTAPRYGSDDPPTIVESVEDLCKKFNGPSNMTPKFAYYREDKGQSVTVTKHVLIDLAKLERSSAAELVEFAATHEIDTEGKTVKGELLAAIKAALS